MSNLDVNQILKKSKFHSKDNQRDIYKLKYFILI